MINFTKLFTIQVIFILVFGSIMLSSCSKETSESNLGYKTSLKTLKLEKFSENVNQMLEETLEVEVLPFNINFPEKTRYKIEGNDFHFTLPGRAYLIGITDGGEVYRANNEGTITCTCTKGGSGCSPASGSGVKGCIISDPCSSCDKSTSTPGSNLNYAEMVSVNPAEKTIATSFEELKGKNVLPASFIDIEPFSSALKDIEASFENRRSTREKVVFANLYGYIVPINVPDNMFRAAVNGTGAGINCGCNTAGSCPKKKKLIVTFCDAADCQSCTMSGLISNGDEVAILSVNHGQIEIQ